MVSNEIIEFWIENGILIGKVKQGAMVDHEAAVMSIKMRNELLRNQKMPLLLDITGLKEMSKAARDYLSSPASTDLTTAGVLLTNNSIFVRTIGNIFFRLARPTIPHRMFYDKKKAIEWLNKYKNV